MVCISFDTVAFIQYHTFIYYHYLNKLLLQRRRTNSLFHLYTSIRYKHLWMKWQCTIYISNISCLLSYLFQEYKFIWNAILILCVFSMFTNRKRDKKIVHFIYDKNKILPSFLLSIEFKVIKYIIAEPNIIIKMKNSKMNTWHIS